ncbi:MAG: sensor histidine kinase [Firmicutes bacterium]|nr:sensor histidine kinase [Bacillota bacterium]
MKKFKKMFMVAFIVAIFSQVNIDLLLTDFRFSSAAIVFPIFLFVYRRFNPIIMGLLTGVSIYIWRVGLYVARGGYYKEVLWSYFPEVFFYVFYGLIFISLFRKQNYRNNLNDYFFIIVICDFFSNIIEVYIRVKSDLSLYIIEIMGMLMLVALIRAGVAWVVLNGLKYYKMLLLKEQHEKRYKKLLWLTSKLKTEKYWLEKNMENIEKVMENAYGLYEKITLDKEKETWEDHAVNIAKDVHEIKKEYGLVVRGVDEITEIKLDDNGIYLSEVINILEESIKREIRYTHLDIYLDFSYRINFFTDKHYQLMSIFRNLVMNAVDSIKKTEKSGVISLNHNINDDNHIFVVEDNGTGIEENDLSHIFSPGFSTKIDYTTGKVNRGLGLSLVKQIVEDTFKGEIIVNSELDKGTKFEIIIPKKNLEVKN